MMSDNNKRFFANLGKISLTAALCGAIGGGAFVGVTKLADRGEEKNTAVVETADAEETAVSEKTSDEDENTRLISNETNDRVEEVKTEGSTVAEVAKNAMPSIVAVNIKAVQAYTDMFGQSTGQTYEAEGAGSGILVAQQGGYLYIVTNNHVVADASEVSAEFIDGKSAEAEIVGTDAKNDLAVIKIPEDSLDEDTKETIRIAKIGDSDAIAVGDEVVAIGNALGYGQSVTTGIVSALNREVTGQDTSGNVISQKLIQTDAAINPGNSGGALLNADGEVIGINSSKYADTTIEGMGFAIPVNTAKEIVQAMITGTYDELQKNAGYLGVSCIDVTKEVSGNYNMPEGVYIANIQKGSAADKAGLIEGQIITAVNGETISSSAELSETIGSFKGGDVISVTVMTADHGTYVEETYEIELGKRGDEEELAEEEARENEESTSEEGQNMPEQPSQGGQQPSQGGQEVPQQPGQSIPDFGGNDFLEDFFGSFFGQ